MAAEDAGLEPRSAEVAPWVPGQDLRGLGSRAPRRSPSRRSRSTSTNGRGHPAGPAPAVPVGRSPAPDRVSGLDVEDFLHHLRTEPDPTGVVDGLLARGVSLDRIYMDLLAPAARRLGDLWEEDRCDYFQVTLLVGRMQGMVHRLGPEFPGRAPGGAHPARRVLLAAPGGEQHTLGLVIVGEFFLRGGWSVSMGRPLHAEGCVDRVAAEAFDLVGLSISRDDTLEETRDTIRDIRRESRNRSIRVILGGRVFQGRADTARALGADSWASDGSAALAAAGELCCGGS